MNSLQINISIYKINIAKQIIQHQRQVRSRLQTLVNSGNSHSKHSFNNFLLVFFSITKASFLVSYHICGALCQSSGTTAIHIMLLGVLNDCHTYRQHRIVHFFAPDRRITLAVKRDTSSLSKLLDSLLAQHRMLP